jgi:hypothetical protein
MQRVVPLLALLALGGCAALGYQATDSFAHTRALADVGNADARVALARMYADPAAWPASRGRRPNPVQAAKWCAIYQIQHVAADPAILASGPSCEQIMATLPPEAVNSGTGLATGYFEGPVEYGP